MLLTVSPTDQTAAVAGLGFGDLRDLQDFLERLMEGASSSLATYYDVAARGFFHRTRKAQPDWSRASTATCVGFLEESGLWRLAGKTLVVDGKAAMPPWHETEQHLTDEIVKGEDIKQYDPSTGKGVKTKGAWESAGLGPDNPFTVGFLLNALEHLCRLGAVLEPDQQARVSGKADSLLDHLEGGKTGGARIAPFPDTGFLTYKAVTGLDAARRLLPQHDKDRYAAALSAANTWAWGALRAELAVLAARQVDADPFELAYAQLIVVRTQRFADMAPADRGTLRHALDVFFAHQTEHSTWPRSRPLFMYPAVGNAYCYDYELLTQMLGESQLREMLLGKLPALAAAAKAVDQTKYPLEEGFGWASGHHRQDTSAESWATASVYHYLWSLQRLVAEAIRVEMFRYAGARYDPDVDEAAASGKLDTSDFADSRFLDKNGDQRSLVEVVNTRFLQPIANDAPRSSRGLRLQKRTPCSAIVYGPPGTSKTTLATLVAKALGWPHLPLDPSHLTRNGLDRLHEESNRVFGMLAATERVVVLLDEFDELVRERGSGSSEFVSRFLTTSMLPKIQALAERRRIVWLLATNHIEIFDSAIRRPGRFDMIVPLLPPTSDEKLARFPGAKSLVDRAFDLSDQALLDLGHLTWGECAEIDDALAAVTSGEEAAEVIATAVAVCTMRTDVEDRPDAVAPEPSLGGAPSGHPGFQSALGAVADGAPDGPIAPGAQAGDKGKVWADVLDDARRLVRLP